MSRGLGDVYKRQMPLFTVKSRFFAVQVLAWQGRFRRLGSGLIERRDQGAPVLRHWQID